MGIATPKPTNHGFNSTNNNFFFSNLLFFNFHKIFLYFFYQISLLIHLKDWTYPPNSVINNVIIKGTIINVNINKMYITKVKTNLGFNL